MIRKKMEYEIRDSAVSLPKGLKEREQRLTKMMLIIFTVFIITYMPSYFIKAVNLESIINEIHILVNG